MYNQFFGLRKSPFNMTPDPEFLFLTPQHREALAGLVYAIVHRKGFVVLTGDAGTGKTTLLTRVLRQLPKNRIESSVVLNPILTAPEFLEMILLDFGISEVPASKAQRLSTLMHLLLRARAAGKVSALIIDEAHRLGPEVLEEIRLLSNFENADEKLLQIVLAGQNELSRTLRREDLRQLKQRIAIWLSIQPLATADVEHYIKYRWTEAGGIEPPPFSPQAIKVIARWSRGIPRLINAICDNASLLAYAGGSTVVSVEHVEEASGDLDLIEPVRPPKRFPKLGLR